MRLEAEKLRLKKLKEELTVSEKCLMKLIILINNEVKNLKTTRIINKWLPTTTILG